ncbi:hypothetical protein SOM11_12075 [Frigoribacterium sp. CFBP9039]|uniref:hypothetical protein n=1 Tax=Frigoribacterium TaxID=96492 RepID=UPI00177CCD90|nr:MULTISPECIES: hypothetical protein [Frigoribacterium]MBD8702353.1 hypothetical protein [Frigoribacterium sp. CFBP 13712]MCJ0701823.1 hypothetical protein [Frigoribacterium faeni]MDY0946724.1 hypothetical protein [Frigoribacterium sp. CFBP9039]
MRFIVAVFVVVLAALMVALGFAQRTVFAPPPSVSSTVSTSDSEARITVVPSEALHGHDGRQTVSISGADTAFAATGRTSDVLGWVGDSAYNEVSFDETSGELVSTVVDGDTADVPSPADSDLWNAEYAGADPTFSLDAPDDVSLVVVSDGAAPAPDTIRVTWPLSTATPMAGPLIAGGLLVLLIGVLLYIWAIAHHRRNRGPRRRSGQGKPLRPTRRTRREPSSIGDGGAGDRRAIRRSVAIVPVVLVGALALSGCTPDYWPSAVGGTGSGPSATPTPTSTGAASDDEQDDLQPPVVSVAQAERIVQRISAVASQADGTLDAELAATRFTGPALAQREANYALRDKDAAAAEPIAIPEGDVTLTLPQQADTWPRSVFAIVQSDDTAVAPIALTLVQEEARANYQVEYLTSLEAGATPPTVAPASIGAARLSPDVKLLTLQPDQLATAYGDILANGDESEYAPLFEPEGDTLREKIGKPYKDAKREALPETASIDFASNPDDDPAVAFATNDAGAIVSVALNEVETVKPTAEGAEVNPAGAVKTLTGIEKTTKGIEATYGVELLFSVPAVGSDQKIVLLGFSQALISAKELP